LLAIFQPATPRQMHDLSLLSQKTSRQAQFRWGCRHGERDEE